MCMDVSTDSFTSYEYASTCIAMHTYGCNYIHMPRHACACICRHIPMHIYAYVWNQMYTCMHTYAHACAFLPWGGTRRITHSLSSIWGTPPLGGGGAAPGTWCIYIYIYIYIRRCYDNSLKKHMCRKICVPPPPSHPWLLRLFPFGRTGQSH